MITVNADKKNETAATVLTHELDAQAYNGNDLGAVYTPKGTTFKVWAPTASRVAVRLYTTGSSKEAGAQELSTTPLVKGENGVWSVTVNGDQKNRYYTYQVTVNGVTRETADIYARAAGVNGNRSMVVDLKSTNPDGWDKDEHILYDDPTDAIVWEVHIKDFSNSEVSGISAKYKGKYLAFTENGTTLNDEGGYSTCIDYLKKLGVTHVQLLPVYDYATVDESDTDTDEFNWGYDPKNYNVPEGSYSTNPFDGNVRIREFKQMIQALHKAGIGVIMDVVYNHTFTADGSWFDMTVPGYYYRLKADGTLSDGSGCGNETASDHLMYRKYMIDSILYWTQEYHIDGFRFDLMGVHDVDTMNAIRAALDTKVTNGRKIIMYGEPWTGGALSTKAVTATKDHLRLLDNRVGAFNDEFRDAVKGHVFNALEGGFVQGGGSRGSIKAGIGANTVLNIRYNQPSQTVSYLSAHDNFTLYDKLVLSVKNDGSYNERDESLIAMNKLAAALTLTAQGITFMQAGEEFARTKQGDENSYISPSSLNQLDWQRTADYADLVSYYKGLIELRKHFKPFRDATTTSAKLINFVEAEEGVVAYTLENVLTADKEWSQIAALFNASTEEKTVTLTPPAGKKLPTEWTIVANRAEAGVRSLGTISGNTVTIPPCSAMILADKISFDKLALTSDDCVVRVNYQDSSTGKIIDARSYKGTAGSAYVTTENKALLLGYDFECVEGKTNGQFTREPQTVTYYYKKFDGKLSELTIRYLKEGNPLLSSGEESVAPDMKLVLREGEDYTAPIRSVDGMNVDLAKFPFNAVGRAGQDPITVNYYYTEVEKVPLTLHYYNDQGWNRVGVVIYRGAGEDKTVFTAEKGDRMQPDQSLGNGWYTLTLPDIGQLSSLYAVFSDTKGTEDSHFDTKGCPVSREVWIENGKVTGTGTVNVVYLNQNGEVLKTDIKSGKIGTDYTTKQESFSGVQLAASTANTTGLYGQTPVYVIYSYAQPLPEKKRDVPMLPIVLAAAAAGALLVSGALFFAYRKKKKHRIL